MHVHDINKLMVSVILLRW